MNLPKDVTLEQVVVLLDQICSYEECRIDHNGSCQEHGWFPVPDGGCPDRLAQDLLAAAGLRERP